MRALCRDTLGTIAPRVCHRFIPSVTWKLDARSGAGRDQPRHSPKKVAALTFDDGPTARGTEELLAVLADFQIPATHFLVGQNVAKHGRQAEAICSAGHQIGNHSWSHRSGWSLSARELILEYARTDSLLSDLTGRPIRWIRPPFGKGRPLLVRWARKRKKRIAMWDTMPPDYSVRGTVPRIRRGIETVRPRSIVCLHDNARSARVTPQALRESLPRLIDDGWHFVPLDW